MFKELKFNDVIGAAGYLISIAVLGFIALVTKEPIIIGLLGGIIASGNGYFLRGRTEPSKP